MWVNLLEEIRKTEAKYGDELNSPVTDKELSNFDEVVLSKFPINEIPSGYKKFLQTVNGLDFNGLVIYGLDQELLREENDEEVYGFFETNEQWHENDEQKKYLFFGDSDTAWYCLDVIENAYLELDKPSGTLMNKFNDFNAMLADALKVSLDN
ncbi:MULTISPECIES: YrhA family protein [Bacillus amyloliquefaciens group]|uniref:YrhA family protein n=1 Tax=Bacillus amyloliquefaciens group TaxID=1938374 RepID=UPI000BA5CF68|nr:MULTISPECIES: YrhA family protein [Bacillus amyloliquefaciens group]MCW8785771.1 SMI1/KNR4 family protein [Bacillus velezensis]MED3231415.1 YrhA family protein [Bacillus velezensis]MED3510926.1 YrhA family protein [Bacillus velezensis]PAK28471.1 SMI1 / KNR4 family protein [Bacillus velezensis]QPV79295.1 SMI1/KNR4 family protein [Bacillus velezensis]